MQTPRDASMETLPTRSSQYRYFFRVRPLRHVLEKIGSKIHARTCANLSVTGSKARRLIIALSL